MIEIFTEIIFKKCKQFITKIEEILDELDGNGIFFLFCLFFKDGL